MNFYLIGIDYKSVSREAMEAAHRLRGRIAEFWQHVDPGKTAVLTTCNRIEIYGAASSKIKAASLDVSFRRIFESCFKNAYIKSGHGEVFRHGLRLACGLESQLKGEAEIMQQLEAWVGHDDFPASIKAMWEAIIKAGREIRSKSGLDEEALDIAELAFGDIKKNTAPGKAVKIMVIGTGKVAALIAEKKPEWTRLAFVARKKRSKAEKLAYLSGGSILLREEMRKHLSATDAVISATSSPHHALTARDFEHSFKTRRRTLYIYDMAMPRDVAPDVHAIPFVRIKDSGDLTSDFHRKNSRLTGAIELAQSLIEETALKNREFKGVKKNTNRHAAEPACSKTG